MKPHIFISLLYLIWFFSFSLHANELSKLVESKSLEERAFIFSKLLYESKESCGEVTRTFFAGF